MLTWASRFNIFCFLDNQDYSLHPHQFDCLLGAGSLADTAHLEFKEIDSFIKEHPSWLFGHLSYQLKDHFFPPGPLKEDKIGFPPFFFFVPETLLQLKGDQLLISAEAPDLVFESINLQTVQDTTLQPLSSIQPSLSREAYLEKIRRVLYHISRGDCYELNFCQEFFADDCTIDPLEVFNQLV